MRGMPAGMFDYRMIRKLIEDRERQTEEDSGVPIRLTAYRNLDRTGRRERYLVAANSQEALVYLLGGSVGDALGRFFKRLQRPFGRER